tara:strand:+ start:11174 stop:18247 length:7074 start_codon:yes stop_codon:yes gene_type:complete
MKYSKDGYKRNSKDKNNPYNIIPSGNITMKGVDFPVMGTDNFGNSQIMMPGADYTFPGNEVFEVPLIRQKGGNSTKTEERDFEKDPYKALIYYDNNDPNYFSTDLERMIPELNEKYGEGNWLAQPLPGTVYTDEYQDKVNKFNEEYPFGHEFMVMKDEKVNLQGIHNSTIRALERIEERLNTLTKEGYEAGHGEFDSLLEKQKYYEERAPRIQDQILDLSRQIDEIQANESWGDDFETTYSTLFHGKKPLKASAELTGYFDDIDYLDPKGDIIVMQHGNNKVGPIILSEADRSRIGNSDNTPDVVDTFTEILKDKGFEGQCIMGVCGATEPEESNAYNIANETDATGISGKGTWSGYQPFFGDSFLENFYNLNNNPNFDPGSIIIYSPGDDAPILVRNDDYEDKDSGDMRTVNVTNPTPSPTGEGVSTYIPSREEYEDDMALEETEDFYVRQKGGEDKEEDKWRVEKFGLNEKKYTPAEDWTDYKEYDYKDKKYKKRYFNIDRNELDWFLNNRGKSIFKDTKKHSGQSWKSLVANTAGDMRVRETISDTGKKSYTLEYKGGSGWRTYARGNDQSGLANLTPEYVTNLKKTGRGAIGQWSSWFDMTRDERKEYGMGDWYDQGYQRDLRFDNDGNTWSGWKYYGDKTPLHHRLEDESLYMLPGSIKEKYNLIGGEQLRLDPKTGVISIVSSSTGSHRKTISQKDMKWFENPGRLSEAYKDSRFHNKHDNLLDYISNPDFRYWQDSQTITLDPITIDGIPTKTEKQILKKSRFVPKPQTAAHMKKKSYGTGPLTGDIPDIVLTPEMEKDRNAYQSFVNTLPENLKTEDPNYNMEGFWEAMGKPKDFKESKKSKYWGDEGWIPETYDNLYHAPSVGNDGWLLKSDKHDTFQNELDWLKSNDPAAEYQRENYELIKDDTGYFGKNQWRYVPKISETVEELMGQLQNTKKSSKINTSGQAILEATKREDYSSKDLMRDLNIFKNAYGQKNYEILQKMLQKSESPKAKYGAELIRFQKKGEVEPGMLAQRMRTSITPIGYNINHAFKELISGKRLPFEWDGKIQTWDTFGENLNLPPEQSEYIRQSSQDLWDKYLGFEPENNTISKSKFSPTIKGAIKKGKEYFSFNWDDDIWDDIISYEFLKKKTPTSNSEEENNLYIKDSSSGGFAMNNYKVSKGYDEERQLPYVSYYDEFDFDIPMKGAFASAGFLFGEKGEDGSYTIPAERIIGKPFELYGRMYYDPNNVDLDGNPLRIPEDKIDDYHVDYNKLKAGIIAVESANGKLLKNPESTASGLYGQRFSELTSDNYNGSRDQFIADFTAQEDIFKKRFDGSLFKNERGLKAAANEIYNEYSNQTDIPFNKTELAALVNFLGRQGTREYLGYVVRDGKSLSEVFPNLYGENSKQQNKTPEQYVNHFRESVEEYEKSDSYEDYILNNLPPDIVEKLLLNYTEEDAEEKQFEAGGEYEKNDKKIKRLQEQLKKYKEGGKVSGIVKDELFEYGLIDDDIPKLQEGGSVYKVKKNDNLTRIARKNNMSLEEILELNPQYKSNPSLIRVDDNIKLKTTPKKPLKFFKRMYDNFSTFSEAFEQARKDLGPNKIFDYKGNKFRTNLKGEAWTPTEAELENNGFNNDSTSDRIDIENTLVDSIYSDKNTPDYEDAVGPWRNIDRKINNNRDINKLQNVEKILFYEGENKPEKTTEELTYTIKDGDYLGKIANENRTSIKQLLVDNGLSEDSTLYPGQNLIIQRPAGDPFLVVDKTAGKTHLYYPGQKDPTRSYNILIGENPGDQQTVTKPIDINQDGVINDDDKVWKNGKKLWTYDWSAGNMQTGAGIFTISNVDPDSGYWDETGQKRNVPSFNLTHDRMGEGENISMSLHGIPNTVNWEEKQERKKGLYSHATDDNRQSYGCINMKCGDLNELLGTIQKGTKVYVLPEFKDKNTFVYQDGKLSFKGEVENPEHPETGEIGKNQGGWYFDSEDQVWREGQGVMRSAESIKYHPVNISIDKNKIQESNLDYNSYASHEDMEFQKHTEPYLNAIVNNKKQILDALVKVQSGVPSDVYDMLIPTTFGIYGVESGMGNINPEIVNMGLGIGKASGYTDTNPDVIRKYYSWGQIGDLEINYKGNKKKLSAKGPRDSVGWTQIKWDVSLDDKEKELLKILDITNQGDLMDPQKAAIATQAIIAHRYNSRTKSLTPEQKSDQNYVRDYLAQTWNPQKESYSKRVSNYYPLIDVYSLDVADVNQPGKVDVQGEYESSGFWKDIGNFLLQPSAGSNIEAPELDPIQNKIGTGNVYGIGTPKIKKGGAIKQNIPGGSFDLNTQIRIYNEYIDGKFDGTSDEKTVKKYIDKINRLYYTDAKKKGRHVYDHMRKL